MRRGVPLRRRLEVGLRVAWGHYQWNPAVGKPVPLFHLVLNRSNTEPKMVNFEVGVNGHTIWISRLSRWWS